MILGLVILKWKTSFVVFLDSLFIFGFLESVRCEGHIKMKSFVESDLIFDQRFLNCLKRSYIQGSFLFSSPSHLRVYKKAKWLESRYIIMGMFGIEVLLTQCVPLSKGSKLPKWLGM